MPQLWVIAGPNGAGKTTIANRWLAHRIPVVSPDTFATNEGLSSVDAGRKAVVMQNSLLDSGSDFAIDTTLSGKRELSLMRIAAQRGYKVSLVFVCVESPKICNLRILERVANGGHSVPPEDVVRRFERSLNNLRESFNVAHRIFVLDNSDERRNLLFSMENGRVKHLSGHLPLWAKSSIPEELLVFRKEKSI